MAQELPQYNDSQPVIQPQQVASKAEGYEAFGKVLGAISSEAAQKTETIVADQSQSMYIQSVSNLEQLKTSAQMNMLEHPDQASKIAENMQQATDMVKQAAYVNKQDRVKLDAYASSTSDSVALEATKTNVHQTQLMAAYTHYANWPDQLKAYQQALITDNGQAEHLKDAMMSSLKNLVSIGAITPSAAGSSIESMGKMVDVAHDHVRLAQLEGGATAQQYHTVTSNAANPNAAVNPNAPIDANTAWAMNYYSEDRSFQGVLADVYNKRPVNFQAFDALQPAQRQHAIMSLEGVRQADGLINSGATMPEMQKVYDDLQQRGRVLSYREMGLRNSLGVYLNRIKGGNYLEAIQGTPAGASIMQDYVNRNAAIQNSNMSDNDKGTQIINNMNGMISKAVSYGYGHNMEPHQIQPIPGGIISNMEQGFQAGNNPQIVIDTLKQFSHENQPWVAQAMKDPLQKTVVQTVALSQNYARPDDQLDYVAANQKGRDYVKINEGQSKSNFTDPKIAGLIASQPQFQSALKIIGAQYDPFQTQIIQRELINSSVNYVKYLGAKNNDEMLSKKDDYVKHAADFVSQAFPAATSTNYIANPRQLNLTPNQMDVLAHYIVRQGTDYLRSDVKESVFQSAYSRNSLKMTVSPTNDLMATDGNNKKIWSVPFSPNVMAAAQALYDKETKEIEQLQTQMKAFQSGLGGM